MKFVQYYLDCLSQASYLVGDETTGRAVVIDPRRDVDQYVRDATEAGLDIELVIETHFHADFLSGHLELAAATGAEIGFGSAAEPEFPARLLGDGERIGLGEVTLEIRHTPGHTPESISVVVYEHPDDDAPYGVLTGDTLFIGDVGRPDLLASFGVTADELASQLYDSLHTKLMTLPADTRVYPAHGAGSACGKDLSTDTWSTIGDQLETNYALRLDGRAAFVDAVTEGQPAAPKYFVYDAVRNRQARPLLDEHETPSPMSLTEVLSAVDGGAVVVDTRDAAEFARGHLAGSLNVGLDGRFAEYAGSLVGADDPVVLVTGPGLEHEAKVRLARIGFDRVVGHLEAPAVAFAAHPEHVRTASRLTATAFDERATALGDIAVVDVRGPGEYALGSLPGAVNVPLAQLATRLDELDPAAPTVVHCAGGYRSSAAASLLRSRGFEDVSDVVGGFDAWSQLHAAPA